MIGSQRKRKDRGFTLIEILVVMGIILVLIGMLVVGAKYVSRAGRTKSTRGALMTAKTMFDSYSAFKRSDLPPTFPVGTLDATGNNGGKGLLSQDWPTMPTCDAIVKTEIVMSTISTLPENKKAIGTIPPASLLSKIGMTPVPTMLLDGWGNPVIYVPAGGLINVNMTSAGQMGTMTTTGFHAGAYTTPLPTDRPFWVSGGEDGDISTGDDNVYSFEN